MNALFYIKLSWNNIRKNYRFFIPRILSEAGLLACFYISLTLATDARLSHIKGGEYIPTLMWIGVAVLAILTMVLMMYTNSFLMKQRKRELGLYNVLGMEKRHVGRVLLRETMISGGSAIILGLGLGILFYKLCSLFICRLLRSEVIIGFYFLTPLPVLVSALFFALLDGIIYLCNLFSIARMRPVELLASRQAGEKEPRIKWLLLVLGLMALAGGYYLSITTQDPLEAMMLFFVAVLLVIIGTYFLFIAGSTFILKSLKKNERYYYTPKHMPAVSGLLYRMKQNAVGLASIAILSTGVLVMVSTTVSLYAGLEGTLARNYPDHLYISAAYGNEDGVTVSVPGDKLEEIVRDAADDLKLEIDHITRNQYLLVSYYTQGTTFLTTNEVDGNVAFTNISNLIFITQDNYRLLTGEELNLTGLDVAVCRISSPVERVKELTDCFTLHGETYRIVRTLSTFPVKNQQAMISNMNTYGIVVSGGDVFAAIDDAQRQAYMEHSSDRTDRLSVHFTDADQAALAGDELERRIVDALSEYEHEHGVFARWYFNFDGFWRAREALLGMYGTLLFLGILLGAVSLFATVLIIYYKQISEGYEDRDRFQMMEKIGMSKQEVWLTISRQVLIVFFLPLIVGGVHFLFAYPMLQRLVRILMLYSPTLFTVCSLITYAVFALVYGLIYTMTSRTYYKIVQ